MRPLALGLVLIVCVASALACCCPTVPRSPGDAPAAEKPKAKSESELAKEVLAPDETPIIRVVIRMGEDKSFARQLEQTNRALEQAMSLDRDPRRPPFAIGRDAGHVTPEQVAFRYGKPDLDDNTASGPRRPLMVTRWFRYDKEAVHFVFGGGEFGKNTPVQQWVVIAVADVASADPLSLTEIDLRLQARRSAAIAARAPKTIGDDARSYFHGLYGEPTKEGTAAAGRILSDSLAMFLTYGDKSVRVILRPLEPKGPTDAQTKWVLSHFTSSVNGAKLAAELAAGRLEGRMTRSEEELTEPIEDGGPYRIPPPFRGVPAK